MYLTNFFKLIFETYIYSYTLQGLRYPRQALQACELNY